MNNNIGEKIMFEYQKEGITVKTILDIRRKLESGLYRVRIRVTYKRKIREYSTGKELSEADWEILHETNKRELKKVKQDIQSTFRIIEKHIRELSDLELFSLEALDKRLQVDTESTLNKLFKEKIASLEKENREGSRLYYDNVLKGIERYKGEKIQFTSVNPTWLKGYERFLLNEGKTYTTVGIHQRAVRAIINNAMGKGIVKPGSYPFGRGKYEIPTGESRKMALTIKQIGMIVNFKDEFPKTDIYRDLWFFSYLCNGINFADMLCLKFSNISNNEISWMRKKTIETLKHKKYIRAYITPEMKAIMKRWGTKPQKPENYIFPYMKDGLTDKRQKEIIQDITRRTNRKMEKIGLKLGIGKISTYTARHSFATVLKRSGTNIAFISESLGHSDLKTTEGYLASFENSERVKNAKNLTKF
jgi:integrase/recombinase XerD